MVKFVHGVTGNVGTIEFPRQNKGQMLHYFRLTTPIIGVFCQDSVKVTLALLPPAGKWRPI